MFLEFKLQLMGLPPESLNKHISVLPKSEVTSLPKQASELISSQRR